MKSQVGAAALLALAQGTVAQQAAYYQCGGIGYAGDTTCVSGYHCQYQNDYYSQCLPGAGSTTAAASTTKKCTKTCSTTMATSTKPAATTTSSASSQPSGGVQCPGTFDDMSAADFIAAISPGWNLGNTLDAIPNEGSWNNPPVMAATFDDIKARGFKSVRIPVTYAYHFTSEAPDYTIDPAWLQRVSDVVDMAVSRGLYVVTNAHHDATEWADVTAAGADLDAIHAKLEALWTQVGKTLACKSSMVALEPINEPPANTAADGAEVNKFNEDFLRGLAASGGFNTRRVVTLTGGGMDGLKTTEWFVAPADIVNPWAIQFHYYSPYDFDFSAWGKTVWGSDADKATMKQDLDIVRGNFTDIPLYIGEFDASPTNTESAARWKWFDYFVSAAGDIGAAVSIWDNGLDHLNRDTGVWRDPTAIDVMLDGVEDIANSLPDSTSDASATTQSTSAFVFHRVGDAVADQALPWLFNGNTVKSITTAAGTKLVSGTDYTVSSSAITFKASFISSKVSATAAAGVKETLTVSYSAGAASVVEVVQWDTPVLSSTSSTAASGADLHIPVTWKGLSMLATAKMVESDGTYLVDDWTQYLPPLQQARGTYGSQWSFDDTSVIVTSAAVDLVIASGKATTFTFEFYPRVAGNSVAYTLNP